MNKVISLLLVCSLAFALSACKTHDENVEREIVSNFTYATMEYANDDGYKLITSEIQSLYTFVSLPVKPSEDEFAGDWVYRIVFNPQMSSPDTEGFVILFGEYNLSINGEVYDADGCSYSVILNWAASKYSYFDYELITE